ncbi:MAG: hypothetical protein JWL84_2648 [Rhodospirillales bacterium]|nr:hypothetical protein [Rhodospirillales bacterium]
MRWISPLVSVAVTIVAAAGGFFLLPLAVLASIAGDLVSLFSILAGLVVSTMLITATIFTPAGMGVARVAAIAESLNRFQRQTAGLFVIYVLAALVPLSCKALASDEFKVTLASWPHAQFWLPAAAAGCVGLALARTMQTIRGIIGIQILRHKLLLEDAEEREARVRQAAADAISFTPDRANVPYGKKISFPGGR